MKTLIIAEPGSTHEGDYDTMLRLIKCAADCKVDVFKNQWTSSAERMCARRHAPEYLESYRKLQYPLAWHASLREVCREHGISETLYYGWRDQLLEAGRERFAGKEERLGERELRRKVAELERALGRKTYELEIAGKLLREWD